MSKALWVGIVFVVAMAMSGAAFGADPLTETVTNGCKEELSTYCKDVTPGEGRILACLYAHEDKLTAKCEYALYDAAAQLERVVMAMVYTANECGDDLEKFCADVPMGEGRLIDCIKRNEKKVSKRCQNALEGMGVK